MLEKNVTWALTGCYTECVNHSSKGACVWVPDSEEVWVCAQLEQDYQLGDQQFTLKLSDGTVRHTHSYTSFLYDAVQH